MTEELAQIIIDHPLAVYSNSTSDSVSQEVICEFDLENASDDDTAYQPLLRQGPDYTRKKNASVTRPRVVRNSSFRMRLDRHQTQSEIPQTEDYTNLMIGKKQRQCRPWFIWIVSAIQICVFIAELGNNWLLTGSPIINLSFNPFFGPSSLVLINMGAGYAPCMHAVNSITNYTSLDVPCPNSTISRHYKCTLRDLCGYHGVSHIPNQWYRFITPIFVHGGIIHIALNMLTQLLLGRDIERQIGALRLAFIYFVSSIFGFVLGSNFAPERQPRIGCSGSIFGIIAVCHLTLLYNWTQMTHPIRQLIVILLTIIIDLSLGLLPGIDNFSHVGGFCMGLLLGLAILDAPTNLPRRKKPEEHSNISDKSYSTRRYRQYLSNQPKIWWTWCLKTFIRKRSNVLGANTLVACLLKTGASDIE